MNFNYFNNLLEEASYDEVKIIGRDVTVDGRCVHIIGMTLKNRQAFVYGLEVKEPSEEDEMDQLPDWDEELELLCDSNIKTIPLEIPARLTCGEEPEIPFTMMDGASAICYINKIEHLDVWAEHERRFSDQAYIDRMLQYVTMEEFQAMKSQCEEAMESICPRGKHFLLVEYECSADVSLDFYATSYLESEPQISSGTVSTMIFTHRPDSETGSHGLKLRGCIIQTPMDPEETSLEAELFSYTETIREFTEKVY